MYWETPIPQFRYKGTIKNAHMQESEKFYKKIIDFNLFIRYSSLIQARLKMRWWVTLHPQESEEQLLPILFDVPAEGRGEFMTTVQISERLVTYGNIKKPMPLNRLGVLLGTAGYQKKAIGKQRIRGWLVYQRSTDEINANKNLYAKWADEQMFL